MTVRGSYGTAVIADRTPDLVVCRWPDGDCDAIASGWVTTPWSWASLPGLLPSFMSWMDGHIYVRGVSGRWGRLPAGWKLGNPGAEPNEQVWLTSERRPEVQR